MEDISDINELYSFKKKLLEDSIILPIRNDDKTEKSLVNFTPLTAQNFNKNQVFRQFSAKWDSKMTKSAQQARVTRAGART